MSDDVIFMILYFSMLIFVYFILNILRYFFYVKKKLLSHGYNPVFNWRVLISDNRYMNWIKESHEK